MAANLSIDPELIERALKVSGERTKKAAVTKALEEFIARRQQKGLIDLMRATIGDQFGKGRAQTHGVAIQAARGRR